MSEERAQDPRRRYTGETETQREIQREKKTRTFKEKALLETSERRAL